MKTLTDLLVSLIDTHEITGAFDSEGTLQDAYLSLYAKRQVTAWYIEQGELIGEATAGHELGLAVVLYKEEAAIFGDMLFSLCKKQALEWLKNSDAWRNAETELQQRFDYGNGPSFKDDVFRALDPTR